MNLVRYNVHSLFRLAGHSMEDRAKWEWECESECECECECELILHKLALYLVKVRPLFTCCDRTLTTPGCSLFEVAFVFVLVLCQFFRII